MNNDDNDYIRSQLQMTGKNGEATLHLAEQQVTVMSNALENLKVPIETLQRDQNNIETKVQEVIQQINFMRNNQVTKSEIVSLQTSINGVLITVGQKMAELRHLQSEEMQAVESVINRKFYHGLMDMEEVEKLYDGVVKNNPGRYHGGPLRLETIGVSGITVKGSLIVKLVVPIPERTLYKLYRLYAIPQPIESRRSVVLDVKISHVAANTDEDKYLLWTDNNLRKCVTVGVNSLRLCEDPGLIVSSKLRDCTCEGSDGLRRSEVEWQNDKVVRDGVSYFEQQVLTV